MKNAEFVAEFVGWVERSGTQHPLISVRTFLPHTKKGQETQFFGISETRFFEKTGFLKIINT